jgi:hypothetical protein
VKVAQVRRDEVVSTGTARCGRCSQQVPLSDFHLSGGRRQSWCKRCRADYMRDRGDLHRSQSRAARERRRARAREFVLGVLESGRCEDCGNADPLILEFDHLRDKRADVAVLVHEGYALRHVRAEVEKCQLVCVNCHRRRTARRAGTWRVDPSGLARLDRPLRRRNLSFVLDTLKRSRCIDCNESDPVVLEFDHIGPKRASVLKLALDEHSIEALECEIAQCAVRCANCHRRRTLQQQPDHFRHGGSAIAIM